MTSTSAEAREWHRIIRASVRECRGRSRRRRDRSPWRRWRQFWHGATLPILREVEERPPELVAALLPCDPLCVGGPDVLVVSVTEAALATKNATSTIPIVMVSVPDPVAAGLVASLARPGGNVTGLSRETRDVIGQTLQLLKEALPETARVHLPL